MSRRLLGSKGNFGGQTRVYRTTDGLEIDDSEDDRVFRKRVFWDEVLMVTLHRGGDVPFLILAVVAVGFLALISFAIGMIEVKAGILASVLSWVPLLIYTIVRLTQGVSTVSVYGRRTMARLSFPLRPGRAREVYAEISAAARRRQDAARAAAMRKAASPPVRAV